MYIFGRTQPLLDLGLLDAVNTVKRCGFEGIEVCFENANPLTGITTTILDAIAKVLPEFPGGFSASYHKDISDDLLFQETLAALDHSARLGAKIFITSSCLLTTEMTQARADKFKANLQTVIDKAVKLGMVVAIEPEPNFSIASTKDFLNFAKEFNNPSLKLNWDLGHAFLTDEDPLADIVAAAPYLVHCHIENMNKGVHAHRVPYEGDMDLAAYIKTLRSIGFDGILALDLYGIDYAAAAPSSIAYLKELVAKN